MDNQNTNSRPSILDDPADVLVNTTNSVGVMGKGLALAFAQRWPSIVKDYKLDCARGALKGGSCLLYDLPRDMFSTHKRQWAAFCTKEHWRNPSRYEWVESGLKNLISILDKNGHNSVAIPALGCSNGGLSWNKVLLMIEDTFRGSSFDVRIYPPMFERPFKLENNQKKLNI